MSTEILNREMFGEAEAARLLRVNSSTLHYWLEGGVRRGREYKPILRAEPTGSRAVTWAEFVEAGLLRQYRKNRIPMAELRAFIEKLREEFGVPYPLAHHRPFMASGRRLVLQAQKSAGLDGGFWLVAVASNQLLLTASSDAFVARVEWGDDIAVKWRPHEDPNSPVRMNPLLRFGRPAVRGVSTEALWDASEEGEFIEETAEAYDLEPSDVRWAISYENSVRAPNDEVALAA